VPDDFPPAPDAGALLDSLDAPVVAVDAALHVCHANDAAERWLGRSRLRLRGMHLSQAAPGLAPLGARALTGTCTSVAVQDGTDAPVRVDATPWWDGDAVAGAVLLVHAGASAQAADLAEMAAGLAHEVRNPLAALRGAAELLQGGIGDNEYLRLILREAGRIERLAVHMTDLARPLPLQPRPLAPAPLLHELAAQTRALAGARGAAIRVEERFDPALPELVADRDRLFEALTNLAKNAVEAAPATGGRVVLEAAMAPERRRDAGGRAQPVVRLSVRDNGPGLGAARGRLFTPFHTTKPNGTGLGLLIARRAVEAHGGLLQLLDAREGGAEARVLLPVAAGGA